MSERIKWMAENVPGFNANTTLTSADVRPDSLLENPQSLADNVVCGTKVADIVGQRLLNRERRASPGEFGRGESRRLPTTGERRQVGAPLKR